MLFLPGLVAAPFELHVLKMRDESPQQIACGSTGMRVNIAVKHEHRAGNTVETLRLQTFLLEPQDVSPGFYVCSAVID
jgi:hypothetical protein